MQELRQEEEQHDATEEHQTKREHGSGEVLLLEELQRQHRRRRRALDLNEQGQRDDRHGEGGDDDARSPALLAALDHSIDESTDPECAKDRARNIKTHLARVLGFCDPDQSDQPNKQNRNVNPERGRPVVLLNEVATDGRAETDAHAADGSPDGNCLRTLIAVEHVGNDRKGCWQHHRGTQALYSTGENELLDAVGKTADRGANGKGHKTNSHPLLASVTVTKRTAQHEKASKHQHV